MKCPNCGNRVYAFETVDSEWIDNEYYDTVEGTCSKCGKNWQWEEVYSFNRDYDIREIDSNDHL